MVPVYLDDRSWHLEQTSGAEPREPPILVTQRRTVLGVAANRVIRCHRRPPTHWATYNQRTLEKGSGHEETGHSGGRRIGGRWGDLKLPCAGDRPGTPTVEDGDRLA